MKVDIFNYLITLYFILLIPFGKIINNYILKILKESSLRNIFLKIGIYLILIILIISYLFIGYSTLFIFFVFYLFLLCLKVDFYSSFIIGILLFIFFLISYLLKDQASNYSYLLFFSILMFINGIIYYILEKFFINIKEKNLNNFINILFFLFIIFFVIGFYKYELTNYNLLILISVLFTANMLNYKEEIILKNDFKKDILVICIFIITIIPIVNDFIYLQNKNDILFITSAIFLVLYIIYNKILISIANKKNMT